MKIEIICGTRVRGVSLTWGARQAARYEAEGLLLHHWSGYTRTVGWGAFRDAIGVVVHEDCDIWTVFIPNDESLDIVQAVAERCRAAYHQQSVLLVIDGAHGLVTGAALAGVRLTNHE